MSLVLAGGFFTHYWATWEAPLRLSNHWERDTFCFRGWITKAWGCLWLLLPPHARGEWAWECSHQTRSWEWVPGSHLPWTVRLLTLIDALFYSSHFAFGLSFAGEFIDCPLRWMTSNVISVKCLQILTPTWVSFSPVCPWCLYFPNGLCFHLPALPAGLRATWQALSDVSPSPAPWKGQVEWPFHGRSVKEQGHVAATDHSCPFPGGGSPASFWGQGKNYNNTRPLKG